MGMTLGQKIRSLRQQNSLSQQQLAGTELTRAFISLVEQGKCQPSTQTLQVLARRLGKPIEYFLDRQENDEVEAIELLQIASDRAMERGDLSAAVRSAISAVRLCQRIENQHLELTARRHLASIYISTDDYERALEQWEEILDLHKAAGDRRGIAEAHFKLGVCSHNLEEYGTARRHYRRALKLTEGKKSLRELRLRCAEALTHCQVRLGDYEAAVETVRLGLATAEGLGDRQYMGRAYINLGAGLARLHRHEEALAATRQALEIMEGLNNRLVTVIRHNLASQLMSAGRYDEAYPLLESTLEAFRERGEVRLQAFALEELARYWLAMGDTRLAEAQCEEAIQLLDLGDDGVLRGRLYRMLGRIHRLRGQHRRADELFRISLEILRRLKALDEVMETMAELGHTASARGAEAAGAAGLGFSTR